MEAMNSNKSQLFWPSVSILGLSLMAGALAVFLQLPLARALVQFVLQPGATGAFLLPEEPATAVLFPIRLFGWAFLAVAVCASTSWVLAGTRSKTATFLLLFATSLLLVALTFWAYRAYMQESVELAVGGHVLAKPRGQLTRLGDVPVFSLGLLGPVIVCGIAVAIGRRQGRGTRRAG